MRKTLFFLAILTALVSVTLLTGCITTTPEEDAALDIQDSLLEPEKVPLTITAEEWKTFKDVAESKIRINQVSIGEYKYKLAKSGKAVDPLDEKKAEVLEQQNNLMKTRLVSYGNNSQEDWKTFSIGFNHDMDVLGRALTDLAYDSPN